MIDLVLASRNRKKILELRTFLDEMSSYVRILSLDDIGYTDEIIEDGFGFDDNSLIKASAPTKLGYLGVADDSGLEVDALGGQPGVFSARYARYGATDGENNVKLLAELEAVPDDKRTARFKTVITCALPNGRYFQVDGTCGGVILREPRGADGFGYDPLFYHEPTGKTFAEMSAFEKAMVSHRGRAMKKFAEKLPGFLHEQGLC